MAMSLFKDEVKSALSFTGSRITYPYTPIDKVKTGPYVNVKGLVLYSSGLRTWKNYYGYGNKLYFDIADDTGIIRVFAWLDAADAAAKLIRPGQTVGLTNLAVRHKRPLYNNLDHLYELELKDISQVVVLRNYPIDFIKYFPYFLSFEEVIDKYFRLTGRSIEFGPFEEEYGPEKGTKYFIRFVRVTEADRRKIVTWSDHTPYLPFYPYFLSETGSPIFGKMLNAIRSKWIGDWDRLKFERRITYN